MLPKKSTPFAFELPPHFVAMVSATSAFILGVARE